VLEKLVAQLDQHLSINGVPLTRPDHGRTTGPGHARRDAPSSGPIVRTGVSQTGNGKSLVRNCEVRLEFGGLKALEGRGEAVSWGFVLRATAGTAECGGNNLHHLNALICKN
jgi:hypothetical protein